MLRSIASLLTRAKLASGPETTVVLEVGQLKKASAMLLPRPCTTVLRVIKIRALLA